MSLLSQALNQSPILVVDDDRDARLMVAILFRRLGVTNPLMEFAHPVTAREALFSGMPSARVPRLLVSDINMPALDGLAFARQIRAFHRFDSMAIVLLTAELGPIVLSEFQDSGADQILQKYPQPGAFERVCLQALAERSRFCGLGQNRSDVGASDAQHLANLRD